MASILKTEPVAVTSSVVTAVTTVLATLVIFHVVHFSAEQIAQAGLAVSALLAVPTTLFVRNQVTPTANLGHGAQAGDILP